MLEAMSPLLKFPARRARRRPVAVLVLGGCRSGKSAWAEAAALRAAGGPGRNPAPVYLATAAADPGDAAMRQRIAAHRAARGSSWRTVELAAAADLAGRLAGLFAENPAPPVILVDCLTLWLAGLMADPAARENLAARAEHLAGCLAGRTCPVYLVGNETGLGVAPATPLGNAFRDANGLVNQILGQACDEAYFIVSGMSLCLKCGNSKR